MSDMMGGVLGQMAEPMGEEDFPLNEGKFCLFVHSGRAALELLLRNLPRRPRCLWLPRFSCNTLLQPAEHLGIPVRRYSCDDRLRPLLPTDMAESDALVLINYFGLTAQAVADAAARHNGPVLVDATTAFGAEMPDGADGIFYSFRKFLPVADGGAALARYPLTKRPRATDDSSRRMEFLYIRAHLGAEAAAEAARRAEDSLSGPPLRLSPQTRALIFRIGVNAAAERRLRNYRLLHTALAPLNRLELPETPASAPMHYPLVSGIPDLRDSLIDNGIALPLYWQEVVDETEAYETENQLARTLLPLPLDQRYGDTDMERLIQLILG